MQQLPWLAECSHPLHEVVEALPWSAIDDHDHLVRDACVAGDPIQAVVHQFEVLILNWNQEVDHLGFLPVVLRLQSR